MAYATFADVQARFGRFPFGAATTPSQTEVDLYIDLTDSQINNIVGRYYQLPITADDSPIAHGYLRNLNILGALEQVQEALGDGQGEQPAVLGAFTRTIPLSRYDRLLKKLDSPYALVDAPRKEEAGLDIQMGLYYPQPEEEDAA